MSHLIPLTLQQFAIIDSEDFQMLSRYKWQAEPIKRRTGGYYALRAYAINGRKPKMYMHRVIIGAKPGDYVDHINGNGLDNRKENLRICTTQQNRCNSPGLLNSSSIYKGVTWNKQCRKWQASIKVKSKNTHIGLFLNERDAAIAYDKVAAEKFGEFAWLNFPKEAPNEAPQPHALSRRRRTP